MSVTGKVTIQVAKSVEIVIINFVSRGSTYKEFLVLGKNSGENGGLDQI